MTAIGNAAPFYRHAGGWSWSELRCYVFLDNKEQELASYEVLIVDPQLASQNPYAVQWVNAANGAVPASSVNTAKQGSAMYACRAQYTDGEVWVRVGTLGTGGCSFPYGGQNRTSATYEVLVLDRGATQLLSRGANEPRLAAEPDRPADVSRPGEDCSKLNAPCQSRIDAMKAMGAYKIGSLQLPSNIGNHKYYKKTEGGIWEERSNSGVRPYAEIEINDRQIIMASGPWDFGGGNKAGPETLAFGIDDGMVNGSRSNYIGRAAMAEPDTARMLSMKPLNPAQTSSFLKAPSVLIKGQDGKFGDFKIASSGDGWLELYSVFGGATKNIIYFLKVDFWRNRVWEMIGEAPSPIPQDVIALRALAKSKGLYNGWAEAYELTYATSFSGGNIGAALGRMPNGKQVGWTLREDVGNKSLRWEELRTDATPRKFAGVAGDAPVGRMLTETSRTDQALTLSGSELGSPLVINWSDGTVRAGGQKVADFLTGDAEYVGQRKKIPRPTPPGVSPGFQFVNKTDWPVQVRISQVGCLYHGVVPPGGTMMRDTGAVWFSLDASWALDGKDTTNVLKDCVAPVGFTVLGVIVAAATGGAGAGVAGAITAATASAATAGVASTTVAFMKAGGASQGAQDGTAIAIYAVGAAASGGISAFQVVSAKVAAGTLANVTSGLLATTVAKGAGIAAAKALALQSAKYSANQAIDAVWEPTEKDLGVLQSWFDKEVSLAGQYAGRTWPYSGSDRIMPQYEMTGGPRVDLLKDGSKLIRKGDPFAFRRVN